MSSDIRLLRMAGEGNRLLHGDGATTRAIDATTHHPPPVIPISTSTSTTTVNDRPTTPPAADQPLGVEPKGQQPVARPVAETPKDNFAKANPAAWERFMDDMTGALDIALAVSEAAKDGKVDAQEWGAIFAKAKEDGQVSLIEIAGMYAGLQDLHDKGVLGDAEYQDAVGALDAELGARYTGNAGDGLDNLAQIYVDHLADEHLQNDQGENGGGSMTGRFDMAGHGANGRGNDRVHGDFHAGKGHDAERDHDVEDITRTNHALRQQVNDDHEDGAISRERQAGRRHDINAGIATALTDIGINRRVDEVGAGRRGEGRRGDL